MFCDKCGAQIPDGSTFCGTCGSAVSSNQPQAAYNAPAAKVPGKGLAIAGMVCGILSFFCFAWILGTLGIIFGGVAKSKGCNSGMATAGIVCGAIGIALWLLMLVACNGLGLLSSVM